jgi:hypothetical protein
MAAEEDGEEECATSAPSGTPATTSISSITINVIIIVTTIIIIVIIVIRGTDIFFGKGIQRLQEAPICTAPTSRTSAR